MTREPWHIKGELVLSCNCTVFCPCVISLGQHEPTEGHCQAWAGIRIDQGHHEDTDISGINVGLFCSTPRVAVSRKVGRKHAMEMLLTGDLISADDAYRMGLVNRVVEPGAARSEALKLAGKIAGKPTAVIGLGKQAFYRQMEMPLADAYRFTSAVMADNMMMRDAEEGIAAFIEKRPPQWDDE